MKTGPSDMGIMGTCAVFVYISQELFLLFDFDKFVLFDLIPSQQFFSHVRTGLPGLNQYLAEDKCLAQGHNAVLTARLKPVTPRFPVKHSTTDLLCSPTLINIFPICYFVVEDILINMQAFS